MSFLGILLIALAIIALSVPFAGSGLYNKVQVAGGTGITVGIVLFSIGYLLSREIGSDYVSLSRNMMFASMIVSGLGLLVLVFGCEFAAASKNELPRRAEVHVRPQDVGYNGRKP